MNKALIVLLLVTFSCFSMKINHFEEAEDQTQVEQTSTIETSQIDDSERGQALGRFLNFIVSDQDLYSALAGGEEPNDEQVQRLVQFLVNDTYFQGQFISEIQKSEDAQWFRGLSQEAKVRFLAIATSIPPSQLESEESSNELIQKLLADQEIGDALRNQYDDEINAQILLSTEKLVLSQANGGQHHLSKLILHLKGKY